MYVSKSNSESKYTHIVSLGYRCSSAGILKSLGLKQASYPFDWLVSRLPIIEHCTATEFAEFLNPHNYSHKKSATNNYITLDPSSAHWVCDESIRVNEYYETTFDSINMGFYLPKPLSPIRDAYAHRLMMNHHDITKTQDLEYYMRCVERWNSLFQPFSLSTSISLPKRILTLYIHPAIFLECYEQSKHQIQEDIRRFHRTMSSRFTITFSSATDTEGANVKTQALRALCVAPENFPPHTPSGAPEVAQNAVKQIQDGVYIIPVKTPFDHPTHHIAKYVLEEQPDCPNTPNCRICVLWANRDFIDAGEIFMGNSYVETYVVKEYVLRISQQGLPPIFQ